MLAKQLNLFLEKITATEETVVPAERRHAGGCVLEGDEGRRKGLHR